jgi:hypothetical protein
MLVTSYMHSFPISNVLLKTTTHLTSSHRKIAIQHRHKCRSRKSRFNWLDGLDAIWRLHRCRSNKWHLHWLDCTNHRTSVTNTQGQCLQSMNEIEATMRYHGCTSFRLTIMTYVLRSTHQLQEYTQLHEAYISIQPIMNGWCHQQSSFRWPWSVSQN